MGTFGKVSVLAIASVTIVLAQSESPFVGTWKMIPSESKFAANAACQSETVRVAADGKVTIDQVDSKGKAFSWSYKPEEPGKTTKIEGVEKESSVTAHHTARTLTEDFQWNGWVMHGHGVLSKDGKRMTYTLTGKDNEGKPFKDEMIFEKEAQ